MQSRTVLLLCAALTWTACGGLSASTYRGNPPPRLYTATVPQVYAQALTAMAALGWTVNHSDATTGFIQATSGRALFRYPSPVSVGLRAVGAQVRVDAQCTADHLGEAKQVIRDFFAQMDAQMAAAQP